MWAFFFVECENNTNGLFALKIFKDFISTIFYSTGLGTYS